MATQKYLNAQTPIINNFFGEESHIYIYLYQNQLDTKDIQVIYLIVYNLPVLSSRANLFIPLNIFLPVGFPCNLSENYFQSQPYLSMNSKYSSIIVNPFKLTEFINIFIGWNSKNTNFNPLFEKLQTLLELKIL